MKFRERRRRRWTRRETALPASGEAHVLSSLDGAGVERGSDRREGSALLEGLLERISNVFEVRVASLSFFHAATLESARP